MKNLYLSTALLLLMGFGLKGMESSESNKNEQPAERDERVFDVNPFLFNYWSEAQMRSGVLKRFDIGGKDIDNHPLSRLESIRARIFMSKVGSGYIKYNKLENAIASVSSERPSWTFSTQEEYKAYEKEAKNRKELKEALTREVCNEVNGVLSLLYWTVSIAEDTSGEIEISNKEQFADHVTNLIIASRACGEIKFKQANKANS